MILRSKAIGRRDGALHRLLAQQRQQDLMAAQRSSMAYQGTLLLAKEYILRVQDMYQGTTSIVPGSLQAAFSNRKSIWALAPAMSKAHQNFGPTWQVTNTTNRCVTKLERFVSGRPERSEGSARADEE